MTSKDVHVRKDQDDDVSEMYFLPEPENPRTLDELCGAWQDDRSAEEIIEDLRRSRTPNLDRVNL